MGDDDRRALADTLAARAGTHVLPATGSAPQNA
jgi:hypothetical protein